MHLCQVNKIGQYIMTTVLLFICDLSVLTFGRVHFIWVEQIIYRLQFVKFLHILKVVRDPCQKITLLLLKSKSVRVIVPESCF